jgi:hypothetical protein
MSSWTQNLLIACPGPVMATWWHSTLFCAQSCSFCVNVCMCTVQQMTSFAVQLTNCSPRLLCWVPHFKDAVYLSVPRLVHSTVTNILWLMQWNETSTEPFCSSSLSYQMSLSQYDPVLNMWHGVQQSLDMHVNTAFNLQTSFSATHERVRLTIQHTPGTANWPVAYVTILQKLSCTKCSNREVCHNLTHLDDICCCSIQVGLCNSSIIPNLCAAQLKLHQFLQESWSLATGHKPFQACCLFMDVGFAMCSVVDVCFSATWSVFIRWLGNVCIICHKCCIFLHL